MKEKWDNGTDDIDNDIDDIDIDGLDVYFTIYIFKFCQFYSYFKFWIAIKIYYALRDKLK